MFCINIHPNSFFFWVNSYLYLAVWYEYIILPAEFHAERDQFISLRTFFQQCFLIKNNVIPTSQLLVMLVLSLFGIMAPWFMHAHYHGYKDALRLPWEVTWSLHIPVLRFTE